jgi:hypothetical protein
VVELLRGTVRQAIEEGWSTDTLPQEISSGYAFSPARALNVARTETARATNRGSLDAAKGSGVVTGKEWLTGGKACDECEAVELRDSIEAR